MTTVDTSAQTTVRAPRGPERTCTSWAIEAAMRMLMNNLDPEVAENTRGPGRLRRPRAGGARSWPAFHDASSRRSKLARAR